MKKSKKDAPIINFVLVHGGNMSTDTWNKLAKSNDYPSGGLLGGKIWDSIIPDLEIHGYRVFAPTLKDEHHSNLTEHIKQICSIITENNLQNVILVGHSYGGMVITGVVSRIPRRIKHLVYLDAAFPDPGESLFDLIISGGRDPLSFPGLEAAAPYVEKLQYDAQKIRSLPKTYILCTKSEFNIVTDVIKRRIDADKKGWTYIELPSSHVPMADLPEEFSRILLETAKKVVEDL
ncbi:MAG: Alpha/beta hydrolase family protein [Methanobacterium sp. PtaB.Bin024]|nr:MAG: Alpha/beta hydrolase family protein [Methanobacterium sp. PtaB.Bin024]